MLSIAYFDGRLKPLVATDTFVVGFPRRMLVIASLQS